jgi:F-type H+-transporting ATPase subunit b
MDLVTPEIGLVFWTGLVFIIVLIILRRVAWKPILTAVNEREESIENALASAEKAREEVASMKADNERILNEARAERDAILKEAREMKDAIVSEAKTKAGEEGEKMIAAAQEAIHNQKQAAITELKNQVADLSIDIAEKILRQQLADKDSQKAMVDKMLKEIGQN